MLIDIDTDIDIQISLTDPVIFNFYGYKREFRMSVFQTAPSTRQDNIIYLNSN